MFCLIFLSGRCNLMRKYISVGSMYDIIKSFGKIIPFISDTKSLHLFSFKTPFLNEISLFLASLSYKNFFSFYII